MPTKVTLQAEITAKDKTKGVFEKTNKRMVALRKTMVGFAAAGAAVIGGFLVASTKAAVDFEKAMGNLQTLFGDNTKEVEKMEDGIKDLLRVTPKSAEDLGAAAYQVVSAGITDTSQALTVLRESSRLAVAGLATTEEATNLLTSAINAFGLDADNANAISDILFKTVKAGKTTVADLSVAFGNMAASAKTSGVSLEEAQAATAALTVAGVKTATAQERLRALFDEMTKESGKLAVAIKDVGIENVKTTIETDGFKSVLDQLLKSVDGDTIAFKNMFSSIEAGGVAVLLADAVSEDYNATLSTMESGVNDVNTAFEKQNETAAAQFQILKNQINFEMIKLGNEILPILIDLLPKISKLITDVSEGWDKWTTGLIPVVNWIDNLIRKIESAIGTMRTFRRELREGGDRFLTGGLVDVFSKEGGGATGSFAEGGIVPGAIGEPMHAIVHGGERIIPAGESGGTTNIVNVNNAVVREESDIGKITRSVIDALSRRAELAEFGAI